MEDLVFIRAVEWLVRTGDEAGIRVKDILRLLNAGVSVETLLDLIERNRRVSGEESGRSSRWVT